VELKLGKYLFGSRCTTGHILIIVYREFLENELSLLLRGYASCNRGRLLTQHDGAPNLFGNEINLYM